MRRAGTALRLPPLPPVPRPTRRRRRNHTRYAMNETIYSITSAIGEGRSWGHSDAEIARYVYEKHIQPLERKLAETPELKAAFLEGFMLTREGRNGQNPFGGSYEEAWKVIGSHASVSEQALEAVRAPFDPEER